MKEKGILLPIFSLPSKYGIGDFGYEAYEFINILSENNIKYWEILPINASDNLPYSPISYYALEENYISLDKLKEMNLLQEIENKENRDRIIYDDFKYKYYKQAFTNFKPQEDYLDFKSNKKILQYAEFRNKYYKEDKEYVIFLQYILDKQWHELKTYANSKGVKIVGDMPIYPSYNSCEVEYNQKYFELDDGKMEFVSGTPPDKYNVNGQKWGNPVYNFKSLKEDNYKYLIERFKEYLKRFDIIRIDHFVGYDLSYKIPIKGTPTDGMYTEGPGYAFFDELMKISSPNNYWVEDLGNTRKETKKLRDYYNFTGQNLTIYSIDLKEQFDPEFERENMVNYTGNHDTDTMVGWYSKMKFKEKMQLKKFLKTHNSYKGRINEALIRYCMKSKSKVIVVPVQDILGLNDNSRINLPGIQSGQNWSWKLKDFEEFKQKIKFYSKI